MKNFYPNLPMVPFHRTPVTLKVLTDNILKSSATTEVKRMVFVMLRNESANGAKINNNNPAGIQADSGIWGGNHQFAGVFSVKENGTMRFRYFLAFATLLDAVNFVCERVTSRGLYIGGYAAKVYKDKIDNVDELADAYQEEWVKGDGAANPSPTELKNFKDMYAQAKEIFK